MESMKKQQAFLEEKVATHDVAMIQVVGQPAAQTIRAKVEDIYLGRQSLSAVQVGDDIEFVAAPSNWGNVSLVTGEHAMVFFSTVSGRLYEAPWQGHMVVEEIDGVRYAIYPQKALWLSSDIPEALRVVCRPDPKRAYATAISLEELVSYLKDLKASRQWE